MLITFRKKKNMSSFYQIKLKFQEDLVWDKHTGDLIGYVDLGMQN